MFGKMVCLSHTPLGYGSPQIQYLLRDLKKHYEITAPVGVFSPYFPGYDSKEDLFPDFHFFHYLPSEQHRSVLKDSIPEVIDFVVQKKLKKIGIYGAGTHTKVFLELWKKNNGPAIKTLITTDIPETPVFEGLPVNAVSELSEDQLDFVILSSQSFENEMAEELESYLPNLDYAAIYSAKLPRKWMKKSARDTDSSERYYEILADRAAKWLNGLQPEIIVCAHVTYFRALTKLSYKPKSIIYLCLELPGGMDGRPMLSKYWTQHAQIKDSISLAIYTEKERMKYYQDLFRWEDVPSVVIYNARPLEISKALPVEKRNGRVILQGSLVAENNFLNYLVERKAPQPIIDIFGKLEDRKYERSILLDKEKGRKRGYRYRGFVDADRISKERRKYAFLFVSWNPRSFDALYASPNKFFEGIADGVPPIAAPHPQCREIIEKYDCGILLQDWSLEAFEAGLREARKIYGTPRYDELVMNCRRAFEESLSWERQFEKISEYLPNLKKLEREAKSKYVGKFVLIDPTLKDEVGHHYHYAQNVLSGVKLLGYETVAITNRSLEVRISKADRTLPVFWYNFWGRDPNFPGNKVNLQESTQHFATEIKKFLESDQIDNRDDIFIPNISDFDFEALTRLVLEMPIANTPTWHIVLRHDVPRDGWLRVGLMRSLHGQLGSGVRFYTDTEELAQQHREASGVPVSVLPIPVVEVPQTVPKRKWSQPYTVTYLGDARSEKGFQYLPEIVRSCRDLVLDGLIEFEIQTVGHESDPACTSAEHELKGLSKELGLKLYPEKLSTEAYNDLLERSDFILALYSSEAYQRRSSHIVVEGFYSGKVVLTRPDCASSKMLPRDYPGFCHRESEAGDVLVRLVKEKDISALLESMQVFARAFVDFHSGLRLAEILLNEDEALAEISA